MGSVVVKVRVSNVVVVVVVRVVAGLNETSRVCGAG